MIYEMAPSNKDYYATKMSFNINNGRLNWEYSPGQSVLILQTSVNSNLDERFEDEILPHLSDLDLSAGKFVPIHDLPDTSICFFPYTLQVKYGGLEPPRRGARYTVFAVLPPEGSEELTSGQSETVTVFDRYKTPGNNPRCDVPLTIRFVCKKGTRLEGRFIKKKEVDSGFWEISLHGDVEHLKAGDLLCCIGDFEVPVTPEMATAQVAYIKSRQRPEIRPARAGIRVD